MKRSVYAAALATTAFLVIHEKLFVPAIMTQPSEDELAEGKVPTQLYPAYWSVDMSFEGPRGSFKGVQNVESTEEATDTDLLGAIKNLYAPDIEWQFKPDIEEDE